MQKSFNKYPNKQLLLTPALARRRSRVGRYNFKGLKAQVLLFQAK
jgi:hypothetical protein